MLLVRACVLWYMMMCLSFHPITLLHIYCWNSVETFQPVKDRLAARLENAVLKNPERFIISLTHWRFLLGKFLRLLSNLIWHCCTFCNAVLPFKPDAMLSVGLWPSWVNLIMGAFQYGLLFYIFLMLWIWQSWWSFAFTCSLHFNNHFNWMLIVHNASAVVIGKYSNPDTTHLGKFDQNLKMTKVSSVWNFLLLQYYHHTW